MKRKMASAAIAITGLSGGAKAEIVRDSSAPVVKQVNAFCSGNATVAKMREFLNGLEEREYNDIKNTIYTRAYGGKLENVESSSYGNGKKDH
jgi:hypothetical protein